MIRGRSDLTTLMTPGSDPEEVIGRRAALQLLVNDSFVIYSYSVTKLTQAPETDPALNLIFLKE